MQVRKLGTHFFVSALAAAISVVGLNPATAQQPSETAAVKKTTEPVFRVSRLANRPDDSGAKPAVDNPSQAFPRVAKATAPGSENPAVDAIVDVANAPAATAHPLDRAIVFAEKALTQMQAEVNDYTAIMAKRERVNGKLSPTSFINLKVRCGRTDARGNKTPFSIYMKFIQPREEAGREVLWIDGKHDNNLLVHQPGGITGMRTFELDPKGFIAMKGQKYPIYDAGLENLIVKLIEKASRDRDAGTCEVTYRSGLKMKDRACSLIELVHQENREPYEFHKAQVMIDDELNLPVRYTAYDWPSSPGAKLKILEQYTYIKIKKNVGLTDQDFNPSNSTYDFPGR